MTSHEPYVTIRSRNPASNGKGPGQLNGDVQPRSATHDISRTSFHVKHIGHFANSLEQSAIRAFPNRGRSTRRYKGVQALLLHWGSDDLFVLPELEDLEKCLREDYAFETEIFAIPSENSHLELMMRLGKLVKDHESQDTLFLIYYGGHARIDESRQSTWCATRESDSSWLQWSAIQTLLERSKSDVLILLDCCAGAASATFPTGTSITETISASSWDAIAPDPGRYSFTNALIEVLQEWRHRVFSAAMLHAEVLARLKHPRPITINGKHFEARSTPVHFMMTSNHKAPSIELSKVGQAVEEITSNRNVSPALAEPSPFATRGPSSSPEQQNFTEPTEDTPHVMISLALEDDQRLDIHAWEQWLSSFPALAKYVKVQGVFKSHSTLLLVSVPVMLWDLLPEDQAVSFVAFIRSNNLAAKHEHISNPGAVTTSIQTDTASIASDVSGTTFAPTEMLVPLRNSSSRTSGTLQRGAIPHSTAQYQRGGQQSSHSFLPSTTLSPNPTSARHIRPAQSVASFPMFSTQSNIPSSVSSPPIPRPIYLNQQQAMRHTTFGDDVPEPKKFSSHVEARLEEYYLNQPLPNDAEVAIIASNLGIEPWHVGLWYHHRREREHVASTITKMDGIAGNTAENAPKMILPGELAELLDLCSTREVLLFDLRKPEEFRGSHIRGAINLRAPQSFLREAPLDLIQRAVAEEAGRSSFYEWRNAYCLVFYARTAEYTMDCPTATTIANKLTESSWSGQCFILKGHYREFSSSFNKYIVGTDTYNREDERLEHTEQSISTGVPHPERQKLYLEWASRLEAGHFLRDATVPSSQLQDHIDTVQSEERILETEFRLRCNDLYKKAEALQSDRSNEASTLTSELVEHLDRGLSKMRNEIRDFNLRVQTATSSLEPKLDLDEGFNKKQFEQEESNEYVKVNTVDDTTVSRDTIVSAPHDRHATDVEPPRRGRGGGILNKMFRRP